MTRKSNVLILLCLFFSSLSLAQRPNVSVDPLTGTGNVGIPLYNISSGQVSVPVSLVYSGRGVKPKDVEGSAGMGWNVVAGGQISRVVRGLPDDAWRDNAGNYRFGWMRTVPDTSATNIGTFTIRNDGVTCSKETLDITDINSKFSIRGDTEPDIFYISAPGLSSQFVWSRDSSKFMPVAYQDLVFKYSLDGNGVIQSFTITNDKGFIYEFKTSQSTTQKTMAGSQVYFKNKYLQYQNGITYYDTWYLTKISDPNGNAVKFGYTAQTQTVGADSVALYIGAATTYSLQYRILNVTTPERLDTIIASNVNGSQTSLLFTWNVYSSTGQSVVSAITGSGRNYVFTYSVVKYDAGGGGFGYYRSFLRNVTDGTTGCNSPFNYYFSYIGESFSSGQYHTLLPDSASVQRDFWGYYSTTASSTTLLPSLWANPVGGNQPYVIDVGSGESSLYSCHYVHSNRVADTGAFYGTLNRISYASGGNTNIIYEPNSYFDLASITVKGNGLRVKQVIDSVGSGSTNNIISNYSYGAGNPVSLPQFAFNIPYSGAGTACTDWASATAISAYDLSGEDETIMYSTATVSQTGAGKTVYQYYTPAMYSSSSATPDCSGCSTVEWLPTTDYMGRNNCSVTYGLIKSRVNGYPFIPNPNYDFERGIPLKTTSYNEAGTEVSETNYSYVRSYTPLQMTAFKYETNPSGSLLTYGYNKYTVFYRTSELTATVITKVFNSDSLNVARADTVTYTYGGHHKLVSQVQASNSDKSVLTTKINYTKDYASASGSNPYITALFYLKKRNINVPVESYSQVTRAGTVYTTNASLSFFQRILRGSDTLYLPLKQYALTQPSGLSTFSPMTISGTTLTFDSTHYNRVANFDTYDNTGFLQTADDNYQNFATTIINHFANQPIAVFRNAKIGEVAYADFDSDITGPLYGFTISGTHGTPSGSHAGNAYGLNSTQTATTTSTLATNAVALNYIFSIWINCGGTSGTLTLTLTGISTHPTIAYSGTGWKYYEVKIPKSTLSSSYTVSFTSGTNISIDDILWYPDVAEAATATYDPTTHFKLDATNTNGISSYYSYDHWGRLIEVKDQDFNIVKKNTYLGPSDVNGFDHVTISPPASALKGTAAGFGLMGVDSCAGNGATVTWHFGDGGIQSTSLLASASHTYTTTGKMAVTAVITSPAFGNYTLGPDSISVANLIHVTYENLTFSNGNITAVTFTSLTGGTNYSFTGATLNNSYIRSDKYQVNITLTGGTHYVGGGSTGPGYGSIAVSGDCFGTCINYQTSNSYTFIADISSCTTLDFQVNQPANCP